ncbi:hypothetical protein RTBOTA2_004398 [Rhodotorula toruloides]|nr:hypothetical protein RTBOTA2_004398 [Rhodotorula toruloides]
MLRFPPISPSPPASFFQLGAHPQKAMASTQPHPPADTSSTTVAHIDAPLKHFPPPRWVADARQLAQCSCVTDETKGGHPCDDDCLLHPANQSAAPSTAPSAHVCEHIVWQADSAGAEACGKGWLP